MPTKPRQHKPYGKAKQSNRQATRALNTGSKAWRWLRRQVLERDHYRCQVCGRLGDEVDHLDGNSHHNEMANLGTKCAECHSRKTALEMAGKPFTQQGCDVNGNPLSKAHHWSSP